MAYGDPVHYSRDDGKWVIKEVRTIAAANSNAYGSGFIGDAWQDSWQYGKGGCFPGQITPDYKVTPTCIHHHIEEFTVWEDVITANCATCGDRIEFNAFPGGSLARRSRWLLEQYITEGEASADTLEKLLHLRTLLELEIAELEVVRERFNVIEDGINEALEI